jgi:hypothetical protein
MQKESVHPQSEAPAGFCSRRREDFFENERRRMEYSMLNAQFSTLNLLKINKFFV